jgi:Domain of Unknown Function (DUF1080)
VLRFSIPPQWERGEKDLYVKGRLSDNRLAGWMTDPAGNRLTWTANHAPALRRHIPPVWSMPITLFNGIDTAAWQASGDNQWRIIDGVLTNIKAGANLVTRETFTDFQLHVEFRS